MTVDEFVENEGYEDLLKFDGFDEAVIGVATRAGQESVLLYDYDKMVEILMDKNKWDRDDTEDFLHYNTLSAYMGPKTPAVLIAKPLEQIHE